MRLLTSDVVDLEKEYKHLSEVVKCIKENSPDIWDYMNCSEPSSAFYSFFDLKDEKDFHDLGSLLSLYARNLSDVISNLGNEHFTGREKILNFLEFMRLTCCDENYQINDADFVDVSLLPELSYGRLNAALLGKGVCSSQSKFLKDLLIYSDALPFSKINTVTIFDADGLHDIVAINSEDASHAITLDPKNYVGSVGSVKRGFDCKKLWLGEEFEGKGFRVTRKDIMKARKNALDYCTRKYGIDALAQHDFMGANDAEKVEKIKRFIASYTTNCEHPLNFDTISVKGHEFEVSKFFEMACYACGVDYSIEVPAKENRSHTIIVLPTLNTKIDFTKHNQITNFQKDAHAHYVKTPIQK